jgi:hypothetical protein
MSVEKKTKGDGEVRYSVGEELCKSQKCVLTEEMVPRAGFYPQCIAVSAAATTLAKNNGYSPRG